MVEPTVQTTPRALCHFGFRRKKRHSRKLPRAQQQFQSLSQLNTSPSESSCSRGFPAESTDTSRSEDAAWMLHRNQAPTAGSPLEQPASKQSLSPSLSSCCRGRRHPLHPALELEGSHQPVTHLATAGSSRGAEYTQPMAGQGGGRQRVQGGRVSAREAVGGRI